MEEKAETKSSGGDYWDIIAAETGGKDLDDFWRAHLKEIYRDLRDRWREGIRPGRMLKTDLYDEAVSRHGLIPVFGSGCDQIIGTDVSLLAARGAKQRLADEWGRWQKIVVSDARRHAFKSNVFDEIISNSTLDHFSDKKDILESLRELRRILKPGGLLIITLDNPWNPVVLLRNKLPYRLLKSLGVIPFFMGVTLSRPELVRALESNGFGVRDSTAIVHSPRILAIWTGRVLGRIGLGGIRAVFHRLLWAFECLEGLPTRCLTGYYVAVKARKT